MNTIIRTKKDRNNPYVMINKKALHNSEMSAKAKGIFSYLMSLPDNWKIYIAELQKHFKDGRDSISVGIKELENFGYISKKRCQNKDGKFDGWEYTIFEQPKTENPKTVKPKTVNPKLLNTDSILNTDRIVSKDTIGDESHPVGGSLLGNSFIEDNKQFLDLINKCIEWGGFSRHKLPKAGEEPSNTIKCIVRYFRELKAGKFFGTHKWDNKWMRISNIESIDTSGRNGISSRKLESLLKKSCGNYGLRRTKDFNNKKSLIRSLSDFLYNTQNKNSQFLYNLYNEPKKGDAFLAGVHKNKFEKKLRDKLEAVYNNYRRPNWGDKEEMLYFAKMVSLKTWYEKNYNNLDFYNTVMHDNCFNFVVGSFEAFISKVEEYYEEANGMWRRDFLDPKNGSNDWDGFTSWLRIEHNVELCINENDMKKAQQKRDKEKKEKFDKAVYDEMNFSGVSEEEAKKEILLQEEVEKLIPKHIKILEEKYEKSKKKKPPRRVIRDTAEANAREEITGCVEC